ncbi:hypothetical protein [Rhodocyclus tenuis]|uniref:Uncharacterized protein n=1 Tax=Rhodocyclus tenuis TaxID=1066 RepID=A0A840G0S8_RHOTE|nr:hypothetical protein [Rhodocyclus tenuis]MBB4247814.1 hypothetical protein [Rhodocyclus tenuis]
MIEEQNQAIEIRTEPNPWIYLPPLLLATSTILSQPNIFGLVIFLAIFMALAAWWLTRSNSVRILFDTKQAIFFNSPLNPFHKNRVVSLAGYSRVCASPFYLNGGWSIDLSGPRGEHLLLARIPSSPWAPTLHDDYARSLCVKIASGLRIADGGGG